MKTYTVVLVAYDIREMRIYEEKAMSPQIAFTKALEDDKRNYPSHAWNNNGVNSFHVIEGVATSFGE